MNDAIEHSNVPSSVPGEIVRVAAAVILRADGHVLLAQRPSGKVYAGYWEFPGGKCEPGESERAALDRELREELGLAVIRAAPWLVRRYVYPHAHVELHFFRVLAFEGEPVGHDGQAFAWQMPGRFTVAPLLPANTPILRALLLPPIYGITMASDIGEVEFLARARIAFERGLKLVQLREKDWSLPRQQAFAREIVALANAHDATVLLNGDAQKAKDWGCAGVHWTASALAQAAKRPDDVLCAASCHARPEIEKAARLDLDFVVLGPVLPTPSHPMTPTLGWDRFKEMVSGTSLPVYALGGLTPGDLDTAIDHGAHGIAMRRGAWPRS